MSDILNQIGGSVNTINLNNIDHPIEDENAQLSVEQLRAMVDSLEQQLNLVKSLIPSQATAQNQLADKDFVNSSVSTNTAYLVTNNGQPFDSVEQLEAYTGEVTNNDYAYVKGTDELGNPYYDRYKYNSSTQQWSYEFRMNNSTFTSDQWKAINSGATASKISEIDNKNDIITINDDYASFGDGTNFLLGGNSITNPTIIVRRPATLLWEYIKGKSHFTFKHSGSSQTWYIRLKLNSNYEMFQTMITDFYGGTILITGSPSNDIQLNGGYHAVKVKRITYGDWSSDASTSLGKLGNVYLDNQGYVYITVSSFTNVVISNLGLTDISVAEVYSLPSNYRQITTQ